MIQDVDLNRSPMQPGERRQMTVRGDGPFYVEIECFVGRPPLPRLRPCAECGRFEVKSGQTMEVTASRQTFRSGEGAIMITVHDQHDGDERTFSITTSAEPESSASAASA